MAIVLLITVLAQIIIPFSNGEYGVDRIESDLFSSSSKWVVLLPGRSEYFALRFEIHVMDNAFNFFVYGPISTI